jgi:hypothetical protein
MPEAAPQYPNRPRFFANRFIRVLAKACVANYLGPEGFTLLAVIAMTEDAKGYRESVTFFNEQLMPLVGAKNVKALDRVRTKAVASGWLVYQAGGKGKPGRYWVDIPTAHAGWDDAPTDEPATIDPAEVNGLSMAISTKQVGKEPGENRERTAREVGKEPGENRQRSGQHSSCTKDSLSLPLSQDPLPPDPAGGGVCADPLGFEIIDTNLWPEFVAAWTAAGLPGAGTVQRTSNRVGWLQQRLAAADWRDRWRDAVARAGRSARCCGRAGGWSLRLDTFLKDPDILVRVLEGEFDDAPATLPIRPGGGKLTAADVIAAHRTKREQQKPAEGTGT